jgi:hypothetical protein
MLESMEMPEPTAEHERLAAFVGSWEGDEVLHPSPWSPERRAAIGRFSARMGVDGMYLITDYEEERDGAIVFRGHGVYGWDPRTGKYTMHWFDSMGFPPSETLGTWEGDTLTFESRSDHGMARYVYELVDGGYTFKILSSADGAEWKPLMEGSYRRAA